MDKLRALLRSRRFWAAIVGVIVVISEDYGLPVTADTRDWLVGLLMIWIGSDTFRKTE